MSCNGKMTGLAHIGIHTPNLDESVAFYRDILGFDFLCYQNMGDEPNQTKFAFLKLGDMVVELIEPVDKTALLGRSDGPVDHLAIAVKDIDSVVETLREKGIAFIQEKPNDLPNFYDGVRCIFFRGPARESIELFENGAF